MKLPGILITTRRSMATMLFVAVYFGCYRALVTPVIYQESPTNREQVAESYRCSTRLCTIIFTPANWLDRVLRPGYWAKPACVY